MAVQSNSGFSMTNTVAKASRGYAVDYTGPNQYVTPNSVRLSDNECINFFRFSVWVNATINRIVADIVKVPAVVKVRNQAIPTDRQKRRMKKVQNFLDNPNDNDESFADIREKVVRDLMIIGRGAMEKVFDEDGLLQEVYSMVTKNVKIRSDEYGNIPQDRAYKMERVATAQFSANGNTAGKSTPVYFARDEVIYMIYQPVSWSLYGHKTMDTIAQAVATDMLRDAYNSVFFTNNGEASGILSMEGLSRTELKRFKQYMQSQHKGALNAHRTMAVNVPVKWIQTAVTNRDMQFQEYGAELRGKIFAAYGMQPIIMGVLDGSTGRLNSEQQVQAYKDGAIQPILRKESYAYTQEICWDGFGFDDLEIVFPAIDLLDAKTQADIDRLDASGAIITVNEIRARRKLPPVKWGDAPIMLLPGGGQINPETGKIEMPNNPEGDKKPAAEKKPAKKPDDKKPAKKQYVTNYSTDMKNWCIMNSPSHDMYFFDEQFGKDFIAAYAEDIKQVDYMMAIYVAVKGMLKADEYGSMQGMCDRIDSIICANEKLLEV